MSDAVLVTGAFGLVGTATVRHLAGLGRRVVATDQDAPANRARAAALPAGVAVRYPLRMIAPLARQYLRRRSPYYRQPGRYAHPWDAVRRRWGTPEAHRRTT